MLRANYTEEEKSLFHQLRYSYPDERVIKLLKAKGIYENTLIVFTSDNDGTFDIGGANTDLAARYPEKATGICPVGRVSDAVVG